MIRVLGAYGGRSLEENTTCLQLSKHIVIDAGNIMSLGENAKFIDYIFLTHSHLDHIYDIPFLIDNFFTLRTKPIFIFGLEETLFALKKYIFNWDIWPDFNQIDLINNEFKAIMFIPIEEDEVKIIDDVRIRSIAANHTVPTLGYIVNEDTLFSGDTYKCEGIRDEVNRNKNIKNLIIDVSFPSRLEELAKVSKHLTPTSLKEFLDEMRKDINVYIYHLKPAFEKELREELAPLGVKILQKGDVVL